MRSERLRWRDVRSTTPFRITVLLGGFALLGLWTTLAFSYVLTARELTARSDRILLTRAESLRRVPLADLPARIQGEMVNATAGISYFGLLSSEGEILTGNINVPVAGRVGKPFNIDGLADHHGPLRVLAVHNASGETIVVGRDVSQIRDLRRRLLQILTASGVMGNLLFLGIAIALSFAPLRRVRDLERAGQAIAAGDLSKRMPISARGDELDRFAQIVNLMVDEVGRVVAQVKTATDAIAHDLRTPLTRIRASLHRARLSDNLLPAAALIVDRAVRDLDAVIERFAALLRISELEASGRRSGLRQLDVGPLLDEVFELYQPLAEERDITLDLSSKPMPLVEADSELLFEAIGNLLDNAIKFAHSRVLIRAGADQQRVRLEVVDDGAGIPSDEREAVLWRFHRAKGASGVEGTGLGLAVVAAIVHIHGFKLELLDASPGLVARIDVEIDRK